jgi:gluconate 2-dehydrogenase gamma chain
MSPITRRQALQTFMATSAVASVSWTEADAAEAQQRAARAKQATPPAKDAPAFFTKTELATVTALADLIIPKDARSGSASDAGVPAFIDFTVGDRPQLQVPMRGGLAWLDRECRARFGKPFTGCAPADQTAVLDDIAWPKKAEEKGLSHGARFFSLVRDLTASGFWSSKMGIADLGYIGNTFVPEWKGCPDEVCQKVGVSYEPVAKWYQE